MEEVKLEQKLTANQLFKNYKDEGGTLNFSNWLEREKKKGIFPLNANLNEDINKEITQLKIKNMNKTVFGFPTKTLIIAGGVIVAAIVIAKMMKKKA